MCTIFLMLTKKFPISSRFYVFSFSTEDTNTQFLLSSYDEFSSFYIGSGGLVFLGVLSSIKGMVGLFVLCCSLLNFCNTMNESSQS